MKTYSIPAAEYEEKALAIYQDIGKERKEIFCPLINGKCREDCRSYSGPQEELVKTLAEDGKTVIETIVITYIGCKNKLVTGEV